MKREGIIDIFDFHGPEKTPPAALWTPHCYCWDICGVYLVKVFWTQVGFRINIFKDLYMWIIMQKFKSR